MEAKLAAYRVEKQKQFERKKRKQWISGTYMTAKGLLTRSSETPPEPVPMDTVPSGAKPMLGDGGDQPSELTSGNCSWSWLDWTLLFCKVGLYLTLFSLACHYQFGAAFIVVTGIPVIYCSTSTRGRRRGEASAYSVFNPHCESIDGTLTGEQFQREIMYGPGATLPEPPADW